MIIDVHTHIGQDEIFDETFTVEQQLDNHERFEVDVSIVQPALCHFLDKVQRQHDDIAELTVKCWVEAGLPAGALNLLQLSRTWRILLQVFNCN